MKNLNPNRALPNDEPREKMFIKFCRGYEDLGCWVDKLDHICRFDLKITINPLVINELEKNEDLDMAMSEDGELKTGF